MSMLRAPSLGPIVGHTTPTSARVWMRGVGDTTTRTVGVAALYDSKGRFVPKSARYLRLPREFDRTGITDFTGLKPDTVYTVRLGSLGLDNTDQMLHIEDKEVYDRLGDEEAWLDDLETLPQTQSTAQFRTFPDSKEGSLSFIFGSCRYPGLLWAAKKGDYIFGSILERVQAGGTTAPRFVLMVGDQIYADKMNRSVPVGLANTASEFHERYTTAFSSPNMRNLLRAAPTYMILDDHEIEDNWVQGRLRCNEKRDLFQMAISSYMSYQWLHSPRNYDKDGAAAAGHLGRKLYYSFECAGYPFFVMDSRTERIRDDDDYVLEDNHLLGYPAKATAPEHKGQIDLLCDWLVAQNKKSPNRPKFIVSPSVFAPNDVSTAGDSPRSRRKKCEDDAWCAFPNTRRQLLKTIVEHRIHNVVFLCGDVHCSNVAEIFFKRATGEQLPLRAYCLTSSAFYWPWAFADGDPLSFVHDSTKENDDFDIYEDGSVKMSYRAYNFQQEDNFTQLDVTAEAIVARNFDRLGGLLGTTRFKLTALPGG